MKKENDELPVFDGNVTLMFSNDVTLSQIKELFGNQVDYRIIDGMTEMTYKEVKNFRSWEANDLLTSLFSLCELDVLLKARNNMNAQILVDITFHHYNDTFPALIFEGKSMEIIHILHADISIDPY